MARCLLHTARDTPKVSEDKLLPLRVMTFNVRGAYHQDGENRWEHRSALNIDTIRRHSPDVVGLQEVQDPNLDAYSQHLSQYQQQKGPRAENEDPHGYNVILWSPERLEARDSGGFWLSETPDCWSASWDTRCIRVANWACFRDLSTGTDLFFLNTHLDHISEPARQGGARLILEKLSELAPTGLPCILTADFNCNPGSPVYQLFADAGFTDAHAAVGNPPANTFHGFAGDRFVNRYPGTEARIDWILVRGPLRVRTSSILRDGDPPVYPSDHYPVLAELEIETEQG